MKNPIKTQARAWTAALLTLVLCAGIVSCSDDDGGSQSYLGALTVQLKAPADHPDLPLEGITVKLTNSVDNIDKQLVSPADGKVRFEQLPAGSYNVNVQGKSGHDVINGAKTGIAVRSGEQSVEVQLSVADVAAGLVIKEIFYSGHSGAYDVAMATMLKDHFVELFNNSSETIYADGLYIGSVWSPANSDNDVSAPDTAILEDERLDHNYVYCDAVIRIPGDGTRYPIAPGKSFLIATNAINFKQELQNAADDMEMELPAGALDHIIDLSKADLETYAVDWMQAQGRDGNPYFDVNNPDVDDAENIYYSSSKDFFFLMMSGVGVVIFRTDEEPTQQDVITYTYQPGNQTAPIETALMKIPVASVIDGVDMVNDAESARWKVLPDAIDMGFGYIPNDNGGLTNFSQRRKIDADASREAGRCVLQDTNNSTSDFEPMDPPAPGAGYAGYTIHD